MTAHAKNSKSCEKEKRRKGEKETTGEVAPLPGCPASMYRIEWHGYAGFELIYDGLGILDALSDPPRRRYGPVPSAETPPRPQMLDNEKEKEKELS